ncbi:pentatricopeptide repeat-containing protein At2g29760, chloroplastic-like [Lycium barbarum]|uniref:pentatricopeptide repeat-containing protein At2g29760, chloroplastic-like n=1 Tax=Lycium barbarum TaxID=112863 RepID=UPI00293F636E|nr:pentatricopeptide repeat-containing protein At2g29760, chloroplastic-like [Lycium barbarum]
MSANSLRRLLRKLEPLLSVPFHLPNSSNQPFLHFSYLLSSCNSLESLKRLHAVVLTNGYHANLTVCTKLISLASSLSSTMDYARKLFDQMPQRDVFAWNTLIRGYSNLGPCQESVILYKDMHFQGFLADNYTFPFVLRSCSVLSALREGREVHCNVIKSGFENDVFVQSSLISLYAQSGETLDSELVFDQMRVRNIVSWTAVIAGYVQNGIPEKGLGIFLKMVNSGTLPNAITLVSVLPACARLECLELGMLIHGYSIKLGVETDVSLVNALIAFYGKCGLVDVARSLFDQMKEHSVVSWNAIIAAYEQNDAGSATIKLFHRMLDQGVEFDYITVVTVISACARLGALGTGKWVHELVKSKGLECNVPITNALIDMYAKCGSMELARDVFDRLPNRSVVSWTSIIGACASHGHGRDALQLFSKMKDEAIQPNSFTFTAVLTACRHSGLVEEGRKHFESMKTEYSIMPEVEQCACMVDLLGRAGQLREAYEFIQNMPIEPDANVWGALLGACKIHGNLELAESLADRLFDLNPQTVPFYILMKNIYAEAGRWEDVARLKFLLDEVEAEKIPGKSSVEINRRIHTFLSGSRISNFSRVPLHEYGVQLKY